MTVRDRVMKDVSKVIYILYKLDTGLSYGYVGLGSTVAQNKKNIRRNKALHSLRFKHIQAAMNKLKTSELLSLIEKM